MLQYPGSPTNRRSSFADLPVITEEEEDTRKIILLRRYLPIGLKEEEKPFTGFIEKLNERRKRKSSYNNNVNNVNNFNIHIGSREPLKPIQPYHPKPLAKQPSPRPPPKKLSANAAARLELKQLE